MYTGINTSGVAETFGGVPAGSTSEHLAKLTQQNLKGSHFTVPSSVTLKRLQFTWGSAFITHIPLFIPEIHSETAPPSLPPPLPPSDPSHTGSTTNLFRLAGTKHCHWARNHLQQSEPALQCCWLSSHDGKAFSRSP